MTHCEGKEVFLQQERSCCKSVEASLSPSQLLTAQNSLHPSSRCGTAEKKLFIPRRDSVFCSSQGCTCFSSEPELLLLNQGDSHSTSSGVKSTFVGQVGSPLRAQPDASPKAARKIRDGNVGEREVMLVKNRVLKRVEGGLLPAASSPPSGPLCVVCRGGSNAEGRRHVWRRRRSRRRQESRAGGERRRERERE